MINKLHNNIILNSKNKINCFLSNIYFNKYVKQYNLLIQNIPDIIWTYEFKTESSFISPSIINFNGYTSEEFLKLPLEKKLKKSSIPLRENIIKYYRKLAETNKKITNISEHIKTTEAEILCKNDDSIYAEIETSPFLNKRKKIIGLIGIIKNIDARKKHEEELIKTQNKQAKINNLEKVIISTISHEFRTPIAIINSNLQLLKKYKYNLNEEIQNDAFNFSFLAIKNLIEILNDITIIHKSNNEILNYSPSLIDIPKYFNKIIKDIELVDGDKGRIIFRISNKITFLKMDKALLNLIICNLLTNALKFSPKDEKVIFIVEKIENNKIKIIIKDFGIGIPDNEAENIYKAFFRASNTKNIKGTGLGSSIIKKCVNLHNGQIFVKTKVNKGTEIKVILPYE